jgi:hypothetical protein
MAFYERKFFKLGGAPGNSTIYTLCLDVDAGAFSIRKYRTFYEGRNQERATYTIPEFFTLENPESPLSITPPQSALRKCLTDLMVKGGADLIENLHAHRT